MPRQLPAYMSLLQSGPIAMIISRLADGFILDANEAFLTLSGWTRAEAIGRNVADLNMWHDSEARAHMVQVVRQKGYLNNLAMDLQRKGGELVRVLSSTHVIGPPEEPYLFTIVTDLRDVDGSLAFFAQDTASLEFAEAAAGMGFWDMDGASGKVHWSYGMELIYGLPKGGFKGTVQDFIQRIHPDDSDRHKQKNQAALDARQAFDIRFRIVRTDGAVRWVNTRGSARWGDDGTLLRTSGIQLDITEQMERDQSLRLQAQVMANMAEGVAILHPATGRIAYANPRIEQMLGYASGAMQGLHASEFNARSDQDPDAVAQDIMSELSRLGSWRGEVHNRCADGHEIWTTCTVSTFVHEELGPLWISVHTDITEQRAAQQARDATLAELRRLSLNIQESIEAERIAVSRELHDELGAALTGMHLKLQALAARLGPESGALASALLEVAQIARSTQLAVRDICTRLRPQVLDDVGLVEACRWYVADWSESVWIPVHSTFSDLDREPHTTIATDMFRVMQELLTNVARHAGASEVQVSLSSDASGLQLVVQDDGHGFDTRQTTRGFGLMGVRERVRHHAGDFELESSATGTRVRVRMQSVTTS